MKQTEYNNLQELVSFNIKYFRYVNKISQEKLAELANLSPEYISSIERELHSLTIDKLELIAKGLKIDPYQLLKIQDVDKNILMKINKGRQYSRKM